MDVMVLRQVLADGACDEQDEDDGGSYPEWAIEVRVAIENI